MDKSDLKATIATNIYFILQGYYIDDMIDDQDMNDILDKVAAVIKGEGDNNDLQTNGDNSSELSNNGRVGTEDCGVEERECLSKEEECINEQNGSEFSKEESAAAS